MFEGLFQPMHLLVILGICLLVFGPKRLPELGKGLGSSIRDFKDALSGKDAPKDERQPPAQLEARQEPTVVAPPPPQAPVAAPRSDDASNPR
jgi:sec-independent protein translocase protein TatA